jgi:hypothetical protein
MRCVGYGGSTLQYEMCWLWGKYTSIWDVLAMGEVHFTPQETWQEEYYVPSHAWDKRNPHLTPLERVILNAIQRPYLTRDTQRNSRYPALHRPQRSQSMSLSTLTHEKYIVEDRHFQTLVLFCLYPGHLHELMTTE